MAGKLVTFIAQLLFELVVDRLIAFFKLQKVAQLVFPLVGLSFLTLGVLGAWQGWW